MNSKDTLKEAWVLANLFDPKKWIPCVQYMHTIDSDKVHLENRTNEQLCDESDATVDTFRAELEKRGFSCTQGYYTNRDKLERGCGSLVEFQKYLKSR